jgi:hypothetical protein
MRGVDRNSLGLHKIITVGSILSVGYTFVLCDLASFCVKLLNKMTYLSSLLNSLSASF